MNALLRSVYLPIEGGVWVLEDKSGKQFLPVNMPQALKVPQLRSSCQFSLSSDTMSIFQVGEAIRIISYKIL